jgi:hypothetical protein
MKKPIPQKLLVQITAVMPLDAEVVPLNFQYEDKDYNIAVFVDLRSPLKRATMAPANVITSGPKSKKIAWSTIHRLLIG